MSLTVAQTFRTAYNLWSLSQERISLPDNKKDADFHNNYIQSENQHNAKELESKTLLIDFNAEPNQNRISAWVRLIFFLQRWGGAAEVGEKDEKSFFSRNIENLNM